MFAKFNMRLHNNVSYITLHAAGIHFSYEEESGIFNQYNGKAMATRHDVNYIIIPTIEGNFEDMIDIALRDFYTKGVLRENNVI